MKVLVTGGMGFIGSALTRRLLQNTDNAVIIVDNLSKQIHGEDADPVNFESDRVEFFQGSVNDRELMQPILENCDSIVHLAAETGTGQSMYEIEKYSFVNNQGTALLLDILANNSHNLKKFVIASSRAIYGEGKYECSEHGIQYPPARLQSDLDSGRFEHYCSMCQNEMVPVATDEKSLLSPSSFYGLTKQFQEQMVMTMCPYIGVVAVALRFQNVFGPGQSLKNPYTGILSIFSTLIRNGKNIEIFEDGLESRDFVFIDDTVEAIFLALHSPGADNEIFNVGSGIKTSVIEIAEALLNSFLETSELKVTGKYRLGDIRHNFADLSKAKEMIKYEPQWSFKEGLEQFITWVKNQDLEKDLYQDAMNEMSDRGLFR